MSETNHTYPPAEVLAADERREQALLDDLADLGYRIAVPCSTCGAWLVAPKSVALHQGPKCRAKVGEAA